MVTFAKKPSTSSDILRRTATLYIGMFLCLGLSAQSALLQNEGADLTVQSGASVTVQGHLTNDLDGTFDNLGTIRLSGDWTNDAANELFVPGGDGWVDFFGGDQNVFGTNLTQFANVLLSGDGIKRQISVDAEVVGVLDLQNSEWATDANRLTVTNADVNAILRASGFVSSDSLYGYLVRLTDGTHDYLFPTGSNGALHGAAPRYRPVIVTPSVATAHRFGVRMANLNASNDDTDGGAGFDLGAHPPTITAANVHFYHNIARLTGTDPADIRVYFHTGDGNFRTVARWLDAEYWENQYAETWATDGHPGADANNRMATRELQGEFAPDKFVLARTCYPRHVGTISGDEVFCGPQTVGPITVDQPATNGDGPLEYQWEQSVDGGLNWTDIPGATGESYAPGFLSGTTHFRRGVRVLPFCPYHETNVVSKEIVDTFDAVADQFSVCPGDTVQQNVLFNDVFAPATTQLNVLVAPANGTLDFGANGFFQYVPDAAVCAADSFRYEICSTTGSGCCDAVWAVLRFDDATAPTLLDVPADLVIHCDDLLPEETTVNATDNCPQISVGFDEVISNTDDDCGAYLVTRTWTATDVCGNATAGTQLINAVDQTPPDLYRVQPLADQLPLVAGVTPNVTHRWKTVSLPYTFAAPPVVLANPVTQHEAGTVLVQVRNVTNTQFQIRLAEEEANDPRHAEESVAWTALPVGSLTATLAVDTASVGNAATTVPFSETYAAAPLLFATAQTRREPDVASPRFIGLSGSQVELRLQEETSADGETVHVAERLGLLTLAAAGDLTRADGEVFGESGIATVDHTWTAISFGNTYHNPVVLANAPSLVGSNGGVAQIRNVTPTGFELRFAEWDHLDGNHADETVAWLVVEGSLPLDPTVSCDAIPAPLSVGSQLVAADNCDAVLPVEYSETVVHTGCQNHYLERTYQLMDNCGNFTQRSYRIHLIDTVPPSFTVPVDTSVVCAVFDNDPAGAAGSPTDLLDNCDADPPLTYADVVFIDLGCSRVLYRTWTATDACGNTSEQTQTINVYDPDKDEDRDGVPDFLDLDRDNDGIANDIERMFAEDYDGDGISNDLDRDSDNDGIPDALEAGFVDLQGDGGVDNVFFAGWDSDNDGFAEGFDADDNDPDPAASIAFDPYSLNHDWDQDSIPNYLDADSDNDGIPDLVELYGMDTDGDGRIDHLDLLAVGGTLDADGDGTIDLYDADLDTLFGPSHPERALLRYDGVSYTAGLPGLSVDVDGDGIPNHRDLDSDNDGIPDLIEAGGADPNGNGRIGPLTDTDQNGLDDVYAVSPLITTEGDGATPDGRPEDVDGNGSPYLLADADLDGTPNHLDLDSDGDGLFDIVEIGRGHKDLDQDGRVDATLDGNQDGLPDLVAAEQWVSTEADTDADGRPDDGNDFDASPYRTPLPDGTLGTADGNPEVDADGDGQLNAYDPDSDDDLLPDALETDADGTYDPDVDTNPYDRDTDDDFIPDGVEDENKDGAWTLLETDPLLPDTDGDTLLDGVEDANQDAAVDAGESDPRDPCDPFLSPACKGLVLDVKVKLQGALMGNTTAGYMRDDLRTLGYLPTTEPYSALLHFVHVGPEGGGETVDPAVLEVTGQNAIVDWVLLELRPATDSLTVVGTRAALLQRDGDVVDTDGVSLVRFDSLSAGNYFVAVRHRNHLGVRTLAAPLLSRTPTLVDFINPGMAVRGLHPQATVFGERALYAGDLNQDGRSIYRGPNNDMTTLLFRVLNEPANTDYLVNYIVHGYEATDLDLNGQSIFQGPNNEQSKLLLQVIQQAVHNVNFLSNFVLLEQIEP